MARVQTKPVGRTDADHSSQRNRDLTVAPKAKLTTRNLSHRDYRKKQENKEHGTKHPSIKDKLRIQDLDL